MTDRCSLGPARTREHSYEPTSCEPTPEDLETQRAFREQDAEREAEVRRNQYFASGTDEGGRSVRAMSDASSWAPMLNDDPRLKDSLRTARLDPPIRPDPYGNAIIAAVAGGVVAGVKTAAAEALAPSLGVKPVAQHIAVEVGKRVAKSVVDTAVKSTMTTPPDPSALPSSQDATPGPPAPQPTTEPAGRSGRYGTSEVVNAPNQSLGPLVIQG